MYVVYTLFSMGSFIIDTGSDLVRAANRIRSVYLLGLYLYAPIADTGFNVITLGSQVVALGRSFESVYNELRNGAVLSGVLQSLTYWAGALINFISNPYPFVLSIVRSAFSGIDMVLHSTYAFILPHVLQIIYNNFGFLRDLSSYVAGIVDNLVPDFYTLRFNPAKWVFDRLSAYSNQAARILLDPDEWLREKVRVFFPTLFTFLDNPADYIVDKFSERLEAFADRYMLRIVKIAENIISAIF